MTLYQPQNNNGPNPGDKTFFVILWIVIIAIASAVIYRIMHLN